MRARWLDRQEVIRWLTLRCDHCGHRFRWKRDARHSFGNRDGKVWHGPCLEAVYLRRERDEYLDVLAITADLAGLDGRTVRGAAELRAESDTERSQISDKVWRAFYALEKRAEHEPGGMEA